MTSAGPGLTHDDYLATRHFPALDGLRAIAALLVIAFHYAGPVAGPLSGSYGLPVFFVLSGYLITTLALREETQSGSVSLQDFWLRRFFRIGPVYFVVILLTLGHDRIGSWEGFARTRDFLPYFLTFNAEYAPPTDLLHTWTIGVEQKFYLVWPLLAFGLALRFRHRAALAGALTAASVVTVLGTETGPYINYGVILVGCVLALAMHQREGFRLLRWLTRPRVALGAGLAFLWFHLSLPSINSYLGLGLEQSFMIYAVAVALLIPAVVGVGAPRSVLAAAPLAFIGKRSYSLYLVQVLASYVVAWGLPSIGRSTGSYGVVVALTGLAMATILYAAVEQPCIRLGRRLVAARGARAQRREEAQLAGLPLDGAR